MKIVLAFFIFFNVFSVAHAKSIKSKNLKKSHPKRDYIKEDSIYMAEPYPYILPILGDKAHERGYKPQLPFGIMFNSLVVKQTLELTNMQVGFGNFLSSTTPRMFNLDSITAFDPLVTQTSTFNVRVDAWILPFLNIYGILGKIKTADIDVNMTEPFPLSVQTSIEGWYSGFGAMMSGKLGPLFLSIDANRNYNHNPRLSDPAIITMGSFRLGPIINIPKRPNMKVVLWVGAMYSKFNSLTQGTINTADLAPNAGDKVDEMHEDLDQWYNDLGPVKQNLYNNTYENLGSGLDLLKDGVNSTYIAYQMDKTSLKPWNMLLGVQYQYNDHWQARVEAQLLGARIAGLFSVNYRFGIKGRTWGSGKNK